METKFTNNFTGNISDYISGDSIRSLDISSIRKVFKPVISQFLKTNLINRNYSLDSGTEVKITFELKEEFYSKVNYFIIVTLFRFIRHLTIYHYSLRSVRKNLNLFLLP